MVFKNFLASRAYEGITITIAIATPNGIAPSIAPTRAKSLDQ